jgi:antitoxin (DNA-binding transcriptional repressor) of toxin-antitoxin stability system
MEVHMKFVTVRDFRSRPGQLWKELAKNDEMILTSNGKPIAMLTPLSDKNMETTVRTMRKARATAAVTALQLQSLRSGNDRMTLQEINGEIRNTRQRRRSADRC